MFDGSVAEWLKAHDSKSCGQQCLGGSNPLASATKGCQFGILVPFLGTPVLRGVSCVFCTNSVFWAENHRNKFLI